MISSVGLFSRFTFAFYAAPVILYFICGNELEIRSIDDLKIFFRKGRERMVKTISYFLLGFLAVSVFIVTIDGIFYDRFVFAPNRQNSSPTTWRNILSFITPLNFFLYNIDSSNVANHGLHPRFTHGTVNMFVMFGPLALIFWIACFRGEETFAALTPSIEHRFVNKVCFTSMLSGLVFLSLSPHQEPRFLLPMVVPLSLTCGRVIAQKKSFRVFWLFFNTILLIFFGFWHQGGVVPSMFKLGDVLCGSCNNTIGENSVGNMRALIFAHTYMPPTFLMKQNCCADLYPRLMEDSKRNWSTKLKEEIPIEGEHVSFLDIKGESVGKLAAAIEMYLRCNDSQCNPSYLICVSPRWVLEVYLPEISSTICEKYNCHTAFSIAPHLSTEDISHYESMKSWISSSQIYGTEIKCKDRSDPPIH